MRQTILVTGGTGYIGAWVVKGLLEHGHMVRVTVRNVQQKEKYQFLVDIAEKTDGSIEFWEADLLKTSSYDAAAEGCDAIAHVASPFKLKIKNAQKDLVDPAVIGTTNVLEAANKSGTVKKVVLTSSVAAIYGDNMDMKNQHLSSFTEEHFNNTSSLTHQPYSFSKAEAEKKAWAMAKQQSGWQLVVMNPSFVMGPPLSNQSESESLKFMSNMLSGNFRTGSAELYFGFVDVRDVTRAHIYALENDVEGRFILSERVADMLTVASIIRTYYGNRYKLPASNNPKWFVSLIGRFFGLTPKYVKNNVGIPIAFDNSKSIQQLNMKYMPLEQTIQDMVESMESFQKIDYVQ